MTWLDLANLVYEKCNALSPRGAHLHLDTAAWIRTWTPHQNCAADLAARHFARTKEWPPMEPDPACQLYFRCLFAIERCIQADVKGPALEQTPQAEQAALEHLLTEAWHLNGLEWATQRYATHSVKAGRAYAH